MIRPVLSIHAIGKSRFWTGIGIGVFFALGFYLFFAGLREIMTLIMLGLGEEHPVFGRQMMLDVYNPLGFSPALRYGHNLFYAGMAAALGQVLMLTIWTTHRGIKEHRSSRLHRLWTRSSSFFTLGLVPYVLLKYAQTYWLYFYLASYSTNYEPEIDLVHDYKGLLMLFVVWLLLEAWRPMRLTYRCGQWMLWSLVLTTLVAVLLAFLHPLAF